MYYCSIYFSSTFVHSVFVIVLFCDVNSCGLSRIANQIRTLMARTSLGLWKFVPDTGSSSH